MSLTTLLLGRRLANRAAKGRKIGAFEGVPPMGLDGRTQVLRHCGHDVLVLVVPCQLEAPKTEQVLAEEEPQTA